MEKETYEGIEKIADNLQAAAGRKKCREIERANSFYEGYEQVASGEDFRNSC